ncbi:hypothetical protein VCHA53O466_50076 [Vibrio chagasii]|nr:hypothetical protein VCHA53O466_50076 [Vibrio chagasii]
MNKIDKLIKLLSDSGDPDFVEMSKNLIKSKLDFDDDTERAISQDNSHCITFNASTDDDFLMDGETYDIHKEFFGSSLMDVHQQLETWLTETVEYSPTHYSYGENRHLVAFKNSYIPEILKATMSGVSYSTGGNWEIDVDYRKPMGEHEASHFTVLGVTLDTKTGTPYKALEREIKSPESGCNYFFIPSTHMQSVGDTLEKQVSTLISCDVTVEDQLGDVKYLTLCANTHQGRASINLIVNATFGIDGRSFTRIRIPSSNTEVIDKLQKAAIESEGYYGRNSKVFTSWDGKITAIGLNKETNCIPFSLGMVREQLFAASQTEAEMTRIRKADANEIIGIYKEWFDTDIAESDNSQFNIPCSLIFRIAPHLLID